MLILSIETSCDDTSIAILEAEGRKWPCFNILANIVSSQTEIHAPYGGIVPSLAARAHQRNLPVVLEKALSEAKLKNKVDLIAVTVGPGLEPSLWAGVCFAKSLALVSRIPIIGVNHIEGHIYVNFQFPNPRLVSLGRTIFHPTGGRPKGDNFQTNSKFKIQNSRHEVIKFPVLCLVVSGGHTQLILMIGHGKYRLLGETRDDAAGEAFDKVAKLLNLGYPGGPVVAAEAAKWKSQIPNPKSKTNSKLKDLKLKTEIMLPRPMINSKDYDFSFSGLKTAVLYKIRELDKFPRSNPFGMLRGRQVSPKQSLRDATGQASSTFQEAICAEFQQAVIDVLIKKTLRAAKEYGVKSILCGGGVMANKELRAQLKTAVQDELPDVSLRIPPTEFCTDNAVMTGIAGYYRFLRDGADKLGIIKADGNMKL